MRTPLIIVMLKAPQLGLTKTRLAAEIGADAALAAYRTLLGYVLPTLASLDWPVQLRFTPDDAGRELETWRQPGWQLTPQGPGDLGERLDRAVVGAVEAGFDRIVVIGADCPYLESRDFQETSTALADHDLVLGPAEDGGYWLIGLSRHAPQIFQSIPWSTDQVLATTLAAAAQAGLRTHLLRRLSDVDTADDWRRYQESLRALRPF